MTNNKKTVISIVEEHTELIPQKFRYDHAAEKSWLVAEISGLLHACISSLESQKTTVRHQSQTPMTQTEYDEYRDDVNWNNALILSQNTIRQACSCNECREALKV